VPNLVAVFGGIPFCTQWFAYLGATPVSVLTAGILVLVFAMILWRLNRRASVPLSSSV
jgi:iron complex transport system permease protein